MRKCANGLSGHSDHLATADVSHARTFAKDYAFLGITLILKSAKANFVHSKRLLRTPRLGRDLSLSGLQGIIGNFFDNRI
jgi:hypothetical protein